MTLREKYGEWGIILGATEGVGKAFCERLAKEGMNVVMVGRREEKLKELGEELKNTYEIDYKVVKADFSLPDATDKFLLQQKIWIWDLWPMYLLTLFWQNPGYTLGKA